MKRKGGGSAAAPSRHLVTLCENLEALSILAINKAKGEVAGFVNIVNVFSDMHLTGIAVSRPT